MVLSISEVSGATADIVALLLSQLKPRLDFSDFLGRLKSTNHWHDEFQKDEVENVSFTKRLAHNVDGFLPVFRDRVEDSHLVEVVDQTADGKGIVVHNQHLELAALHEGTRKLEPGRVNSVNAFPDFHRAGAVIAFELTIRRVGLGLVAHTASHFPQQSFVFVLCVFSE